MTNGKNDWGVGFSKIAWFENLLKSHANVKSVTRHHDICFTIVRSQPGDTLQVLCCDEYVAGVTIVQRALAEFGKIDIIHVGGNWNGYTREAKEQCVAAKIGLYVTDEMSGALWAKKFWAYSKKDEDGNPAPFYKSA